MDLEYLIETYDYSEYQMERQERLMGQLNKIWKNVIDELKFCRDNGMDSEELNKIITNGLFKLFFYEYRDLRNKLNKKPELKFGIRHRKTKLFNLRNTIREL